MKSVLYKSLKNWVFASLSFVVLSFYGSSSFAGKPANEHGGEDKIEGRKILHASSKVLKRTTSRSKHLEGVKAEGIRELLRLSKESGDVEVRHIALNMWADALEARASASSDARFRTKAAIELSELAKALYKDGFVEAASLRASSAVSVTGSLEALDSYRWLIQS